MRTRGVVRGKTIVLEAPSPWPDGTVLDVTLSLPTAEPEDVIADVANAFADGVCQLADAVDEALRV